MGFTFDCEMKKKKLFRWSNVKKGFSRCCIVVLTKIIKTQKYVEDAARYTKVNLPLVTSYNFPFTTKVRLGDDVYVSQDVEQGASNIKYKNIFTNRFDST